MLSCDMITLNGKCQIPVAAGKKLMDK